MSVVVFSHGIHGFPQMVRLRYWQRGYGRMPYPPNLCASVSICGRLSLPEGSVCSACSVGTLSLFALLVLQRQLHQRGSILPRNPRNSRNVRLRYWQRGYGRMPYPPNLCTSVQSVGCFLCQKVLCVLRVLWEHSPRLLVYERGSILPRNSRNVRLRYWQRGYGRMPYPTNLCTSVPICGRHFSARRFCVFCVFCGNTLSVCFVGAAEAAAPAW
jgi:hypothetical protein